jgi:hypothetical protein
MYHAEKDKGKCDLRGKPQVFVESESQIHPEIERRFNAGSRRTGELRNPILLHG